MKIFCKFQPTSWRIGVYVYPWKFCEFRKWHIFLNIPMVTWMIVIGEQYEDA